MMPGGRTRLFVYGTLRRGGGAEGLLRGFERLGPAQVRGTLHDVEGRFPALVPEGEGAVRGEVWAGPEEALARLDAYEGVGEGLFRRVRLEAAGKACWAYVAGPRLLGRLSAATVLPGGEWPAAGG